MRQVKILLIAVVLLLAFGLSHHWEPTVTAQSPVPLGAGKAAKQLLQPAPAATLDPAAVDFGKKILSDETFGNEVFWTQTVGLLNGTVEVSGQSVPVAGVVLDAIDGLDGVKGNLFTGNGGAFTENLVLTLPEKTTLDGAIQLPAGKFPTGLAVPKGSPVPLGVIPVAVNKGTAGALNPNALNPSYPDQNFLFGVSCSLCHERVMPDGSRLSGLNNPQLQIGAIFAFSSNSAALFPIGGAQPKDIDPFNKDGKAFDADGDGIVDADKAADFERAIDEEFLLTPKGYFDVTLDAKTNPTQTPINATNGNEPLLWDGLFAAPDKTGNLGNFVHSVLLDLTSLASLSGTPAAPLFPYLQKGPDAYLANLMQRSPAALAGKTFADIDPQPTVPGLLARAKAVPPLSTQSITGVRTFLPNPGIAALSADNAAEEAVMMAMQSFNGFANTSTDNKNALASGSVLKGAKVFLAAQCTSCHAAPFFSSNTITPLDIIQTEPSRANDTAPFKGLATLLGTTTTVGYKTQAKRFLFTTAPYLHDGGLAAARSKPGGPIDIFGVVGTLFSGVEPEPRASLEALLDPTIRAKVVMANKTTPIPFSRTGKAPAAIGITGDGHNFFVAAGMPKPDGKGKFTQKDQDDLVNFLLALDDNPGK